jgi:hypothetical protein
VRVSTVQTANVQSASTGSRTDKILVPVLVELAGTSTSTGTNGQKQTQNTDENSPPSTSTGTGTSRTGKSYCCTACTRLVHVLTVAVL